MGTDVRLESRYPRAIPDRVACVSVGNVWGSKNYRDPAPELLLPVELAVVIADVADGDVVPVRSYVLRGGDLELAADHLVDLQLPLIGFNLFNFDWLSLSGSADVKPLIGRSIDLFSVLHDKVADLVAEEGRSTLPAQRDYGILNPRWLAETNLGYRPDGDDSVGNAELALALWHKLVTSERAVLAGAVHTLDDADLDMLCGRRFRFSGYDEWRTALRATEAPIAIRRKNRAPAHFPRIDQRYV